jgi:hypothetical protein
MFLIFSFLDLWWYFQRHDVGNTDSYVSHCFGFLCRNASLALGQCLQNEWKALEKGLWTGLMSPFETKFIDIRMPGTLFDSLTISVEEG